MFFRRRKKGQGPAPSDEFLDEDFGYESSDDAKEGGAKRTPAARKSRDPAPEAEDPDDFAAPPRPPARAGGRGLDDATMVGGVSGDSSPQLTPGRSAPTPPPRAPRDVTPPPIPGEPASDEQLPDATMVIGHAVAPSVTSVAWLVVAAGPSRGRDHRLADEPTRIGTGAECGLRLPADEYVSSVHAEIRRDGTDWVLTDLESTNGTFRNTERIREARLQDGDRVRFGLSDFVFKSCRL